jgi:multidrug efflux pump subunit AcrA (membrane-fusion protein)
MHRRLTFWLALIGLAVAIRLVLLLRERPPVPPPVAEPARAPYANPIGARGLVEAVDENVRVAPAVAGLVAKVHVKAGDEVAEGAVLFEQDQRDARALVAAQEAQLAGMQAQIAEAEVALADRQDQWARIEELSRTKVASLDERQRAKFAAELAAARLATMRAELAAAEAQLRRSRVQLELLTVRAARAGRVLQVNIRPGEYALVGAGEPAILLGQVEQLQLRADVDEDNAARVRPGAAATAFPKGRRDVPIPLSFVRIEPYIVPKKSLTGESGERVDTRVLQVIYRFARPEVPVYVGQQMDVFLDGG